MNKPLTNQDKNKINNMISEIRDLEADYPLFAVNLREAIISLNRTLNSNKFLFNQ